ncbi:MAG: phosphoribosylformylglycinamidine cyclo-ligase [Opitutaceae bacterium]|jgi:phosphoribosylformylglycinamidine cyclo-ligase|nr:phosphoribosylformylglycinamidine cyclo-ligase [Opitutaceae bacterium]
MSLSYEASGVNYDQLDAFKRACQQAASETTRNLAARGYAEPSGVRGESAYLIEAGDHFLAHVEEGLGTKNLVADAVLRETGENFYAAIATDTVATIVNDLVTCGALPVSVAMHAAAGDSAWFADTARMTALVNGWRDACNLCGAVWGGGETPTLRGIVNAEALVLAGSAIGRIFPKSNRVTGTVSDGDAIVFLASSGVQTNGLSLCRLIADKLPQGYRTPIGHGDGRTFGQALLAPSAIYAGFVEACQKRGLPLHYLAHITGHGWRKLMRLDEPFVYRIEEPGGEPALFQFLREAGPISLEEAYATFNQGAGFAAYVHPRDVAAVLAAAEASGHRAWRAGTVVKRGSEKRVEIPSLNLAYDAGSLRLR